MESTKLLFHTCLLMLIVFGCTNEIDGVNLFLSNSIIESVERSENNLLEQIDHGIDETSSICRGRNIDLFDDFHVMQSVIMKNNHYKDSIYGSQMIHLLSMDEAYEKITSNNLSTNLMLLELVKNVIKSFFDEEKILIQEFEMRDKILQEEYDKYLVKDYKILVRDIDNFALGVAAIHLYYSNQRELLVDEMLSFTRGKSTGYNQIMYPQIRLDGPLIKKQSNQIDFFLSIRDFSIDNELISLIIESDTLKADEDNKISFKYFPLVSGADSINTVLLIENPITGERIIRNYSHSISVE